MPFDDTDPRSTLALAVAATLVLAALPATVPVAAVAADATAPVTTIAADATGPVTTIAADATGPAAAGVETPASVGNAPTDQPTSSVSGIAAVYPNPVFDGDAGEFVLVRFPARTNVTNWSVADDDVTASLPNATVSGSVAVSPDPAVARNLTDHRVLGLDADLSLANGGETVQLLRDGGTVAAVAYEDAPEGERWHRTDADGEGTGGTSGEGWAWTPLGATDFEVVRSGPADARAFVLPDAPGVPLDALRSADRRLLLAGYTFTSERVADALAAAARRGVEVRVLVDASPVGGLVRREAARLDSLVASGVEVRVLGASRPRYEFHHPKYAVVDDRALVTTENWKPAGTGGHSSRGWGVSVRSATVADRLAAVFRADADWRGATPWDEFSTGQRFETANASDGNYPSKIAPENVTVESTAVLVAPDNAEGELVSLLEGANESIRIQQVGIGSRGFPLLRASLRAARRGVDVRVLLSSAWYAAEENRALVEWLNRRAEQANLPLDARLANPRGRYGKIHAKGVVVDGDAAVVGSVNWNNNSVRDNREVALVLRGADVGAYYADVFDADWKASAGGPDGGKRVPVGMLVAVAVGALAAILYADGKVAFEK